MYIGSTRGYEEPREVYSEERWYLYTSAKNSVTLSFGSYREMSRLYLSSRNVRVLVAASHPYRILAPSILALGEPIRISALSDLYWEPFTAAYSLTYAERRSRGVEIKLAGVVPPEIVVVNSFEVNAEELFRSFSDIPVDDYGRIREPFAVFDPGAAQEEVWTWLERYGITVGDLIL